MKRKILTILMESSPDHISGQNISQRVGITRAAVWKYINILKEEGYTIESSTKKGYRLVKSPDLLNEEEIKPLLTTKVIGKQILHYNSLTSTNIKAKELCLDDVINGLVIVSEEQTAGKGRLGRKWVSPNGKGIWMSIVLQPPIAPMDASKVTLIAAAAVNKAIFEIGAETSIKWPNDILLKNKKLCGILTEMNGELSKINYLIIGIGVNVNSTEADIPEDLKTKATSLLIENNKSFDRKLLMAAILNNFELLYDDFLESKSIKSSLDICRNHSALNNKKIFLHEHNTVSKVKVLGINDDGCLIVDDGIHVREVFSGEISIRGLEGYI